MKICTIATCGHRADRRPDQGDRRRGQVPQGLDDQGEPDGQGPATPGRSVPLARSPNEQAARAANNGALPPDLSLIVNAREGGADYVYAHPDRLHADPPAGFKMQDGHDTTTSISPAIRSPCRRRCTTAR